MLLLLFLLRFPLLVAGVLLREFGIVLLLLIRTFMVYTCCFGLGLIGLSIVMLVL